MSGRILVVDDERNVRFTLREVLKGKGYDVTEAATGDAALTLMQSAPPDLVISDYRMPGLNGLELLEAIRELPEPPEVIMVTAHGSERLAVQAMKAGAYDYLSKPFEPAELVLVVQRALERATLSSENRRLRAELTLGRSMVFVSEAIRRIAVLVERVAPRDSTVLIRGETGTGKELVAQALVDASPRANKPYVRFNCAAVPHDLAEAELFGHTRGAYTGASRPRTGLIRQADGGTILLDEIGELDLKLQGKLLRVLQQGEVRPVGSDTAVVVDVRVLAATHRDLAAEVAAGRFREDLFYRLDVVPIEVPPLRERREDIPVLVRHFVRLMARRFRMEAPQVSEALMNDLQARPWPGNVRQLENTVERLLTLSTGLVLDLDGPSTASSTAETDIPLKRRVEAFEAGLIREALERCGHNQSEAARALGLLRPTLIAKANKYGLLRTSNGDER